MYARSNSAPFSFFISSVFFRSVSSRRSGMATGMPVAIVFNSSFAAVWSLTIRSANRLTSTLWPTAWPCLPSSTSIRPAAAAFSTNAASVSGLSSFLSSPATQPPVKTTATSRVSIECGSLIVLLLNGTRAPTHCGPVSSHIAKRMPERRLGPAPVMCRQRARVGEFPFRRALELFHLPAGTTPVGRNATGFTHRLRNRRSRRRLTRGKPCRFGTRLARPIRQPAPQPFRFSTLRWESLHESFSLPRGRRRYCLHARVQQHGFHGRHAGHQRQLHPQGPGDVDRAQTGRPPVRQADPRPRVGVQADGQAGRRAPQGPEGRPVDEVRHLVRPGRHDDVDRSREGLPSRRAQDSRDGDAGRGKSVGDRSDREGRGEEVTRPCPYPNLVENMETPQHRPSGRISYAAIAWLLGLPLPIIIIALIIGGCTKW